jgi:hypothetical protein
MPKLKGTPMRSAMPEVTSVPRTYGRAPNASLPSTGFQFDPNRKLVPNRCKTRLDPVVRVYAVTMRMKTAEAAIAVANILKRLSPVNFFTYRPALVAEIINKKGFLELVDHSFKPPLACW